ncbi:glycosyltransferase [Halorubrum lacusprofundi]|jgi:glycosyltransferase involved in cell wall biosynthesis|uniref:Glycosyl transferases group 1 n=1 Tax=Halorubrum lacusprofundi TaxID=2247 RepID=A0A220SX55_9EURY|nr:glycosyltransferase [Halorubrum lacusprofundi]ASK38201.1 Glycosyl transferases group 1 [Halorubrum lacusprofundi]
MRILWLIPNKPENISGGRARIARHLSDRGIDVDQRQTTLGTALRVLVTAHRYDCIVGTTRAGAIVGLVASLVHDVPFVVDHVDPISQFEKTATRLLATPVRLLENAAFSVADHVLYVYPEEESRIQQRTGQLTETELGLEFEDFSSVSPRAVSDVRTSLEEKAGKGQNIAIYVGGLEPLYNVESMLDGIELLDNWTLVVLGTGSLSPLVETASQTREDVVYLGTVPYEDVPAYLHAADVGLSLVDDQHTLKILEYGAAGLPIVQHTGVAEDRFGELVEYSLPEPNPLSESIRSAVERQNTRELQSFVERFDWGTIADDYEQAIVSAMKETSV